MRIIAGKARSMPLKAVPGMDTRPTTDRIKETLFNMIQPHLLECLFLDLFAGSGGIGLEAASRGAKEVVLVEKNRKAAAVIAENRTFTKLEQESLLLCMDVFSALTKLEQEGHAPFDIVFMDPPYDRLLEKQALQALSSSRLVSRDTLLIVEASLETDFSYLEGMGYELNRRKKYKTNVHALIQKRA